MRGKRSLNGADSLLEQGSANLTPLIDVVFVVLIFFILIAPLVEVDQIELANGPEREAPITAQPSKLLIHVDKNNIISVNKQVIAQNLLLEYFRSFYQKDATVRPQLYHDKDAPFGTYQMVKNALEEGGFDKLDVVVK